jgi:hypothetical protein
MNEKKYCKRERDTCLLSEHFLDAAFNRCNLRLLKLLKSKIHASVEFNKPLQQWRAAVDDE